MTFHTLCNSSSRAKHTHTDTRTHTQSEAPDWLKTIRRPIHFLTDEDE